MSIVTIVSIAKERAYVAIGILDLLFCGLLPGIFYLFWYDSEITYLISSGSRNNLRADTIKNVMITNNTTMLFKIGRKVKNKSMIPITGVIIKANTIGEIISLNPYDPSSIGVEFAIKEQEIEKSYVVFVDKDNLELI